MSLAPGTTDHEEQKFHFFKESRFYEILHGATNAEGVLIRSKQLKMNMGFGTWNVRRPSIPG
jgi:hypothetical protein